MSPIKPPDGRIPGAGATPAAPEGPAAGSVQRTGGGFDAALERAERAAAASAAQSAGVQQAGPAGAADPIAELARVVRSGALSKEQALDQLVERAASSVQRALSPAQRAELTAVLRASLQTDPALSALRDALE